MLLPQSEPLGQRLLLGLPDMHIEEDQRGAPQLDVVAGRRHPNTTKIKQPRCAEHHQGLCGGACSSLEGLEKQRRRTHDVGSSCRPPNRNKSWNSVCMQDKQRCAAKNCSDTCRLPQQNHSGTKCGKAGAYLKMSSDQIRIRSDFGTHNDAQTKPKTTTCLL